MRVTEMPDLFTRTAPSLTGMPLITALRGMGGKGKKRR